MKTTPFGSEWGVRFILTNFLSHSGALRGSEDEEAVRIFILPEDAGVQELLFTKLVSIR